MKTITTDNDSKASKGMSGSRKCCTCPSFSPAPTPHGRKGRPKNENKLIRQYIPKGTDISGVSDGKIAKVKKKINERPRKKLNFATPTMIF